MLDEPVSVGIFQNIFAGYGWCAAMLRTVEHSKVFTQLLRSVMAEKIRKQAQSRVDAMAADNDDTPALFREVDADALGLHVRPSIPIALNMQDLRSLAACMRASHRGVLASALLFTPKTAIDWLVAQLGVPRSAAMQRLRDLVRHNFITAASDAVSLRTSTGPAKTLLSSGDAHAPLFSDDDAQVGLAFTPVRLDCGAAA